MIYPKKSARTAKAETRIPATIPAKPTIELTEQEARGFSYAKAHCAGCHAITANSASPNPEAPRFDAARRGTRVPSGSARQGEEGGFRPRGPGRPGKRLVLPGRTEGGEDRSLGVHRLQE